MSKLLIIGGTSGIGQEIANLAPGHPLEQGTLHEALAVGEDYCDVRQPDQVYEKVFSFRPTHLVYSAGINNLQWIKDSTPEEFGQLLAVNVIGFQTVLSAMLKVGIRGASVVAISSDAASRPMRTSLMYCASKAALTMAVRCAARELASYGWRVNSVSPGKVADTGMTSYVDSRVPGLRGWTPEYASAYEANSSPLGRPLTKEEVAWTVLDVLFGVNGLTGADIVINGGR
jgi:NAD(P)-dependent dehydrogenase (short-subunit alcohol dehydrogenase family)